jgi:phosphate transport system substrate-binding protein
VKRRDLLQTPAAAGFMAPWATWPWLHNEPGQTNLLVACAAVALPACRALATAFAASAGVQVTVEGGGTLAGLVALNRAAIDIAVTDRDLGRAESEAPVLPYLLGKLALAILVGADNPVRALTQAQTLAVLSGRVTDWAALGAPAGTIEVLHHQPDTPTRQFVEQLLLERGGPVQHASVVSTAQEIAQRLRANPRALGYVQPSNAVPASRALLVDGVAITWESICSGRYPLTRSIYCVSGAQPVPAAERFIAFARSAAARKLLAPDLLAAC